MKRIGAALAVVAMVAVALIVRDRTGAGEDDTTDAAPGLVCVELVADACAAADPTARAVDAGTVVDGLIEATSRDALGGRALLLPAAWARVVIDERARLGRQPLFEVDGEPLASAPVALAIWADRGEILARSCNDVGWGCLAEASGTTLPAGDRVRTGIPDVDTAEGLVIAASQAASILGTADFAANDFDSAFTAAVARLASGQGPDPLARMRSRGPGELTAAGLLRIGSPMTSSTFGTVELRELAPPVRADLVLLVAAGRDGVDPRPIAEELRAAGWSPPGDGPDGLPSGSVLAAIRTLWSQQR